MEIAWSFIFIIIYYYTSAKSPKDPFQSPTTFESNHAIQCI